MLGGGVVVKKGRQGTIVEEVMCLAMGGVGQVNMKDLEKRKSKERTGTPRTSTYNKKTKIIDVTTGQSQNCVRVPKRCVELEKFGQIVRCFFKCFIAKL